jgi:hypothetical protein
MAANISKQSFIENSIVPANDNDAFINDQCVICWDSYDDDNHPSVRVLPCNHIFGRGCLLHMIDGPNGDKCPYCKASWFRPPLHIAIQRRVTNILEPVEVFLAIVIDPIIETIMRVVNERLDALPYGIGNWVVQLLYFLAFKDNVYYYADLIIAKFTNLKERNPRLNLSNCTWRYYEMLVVIKPILKVVFGSDRPSKNYEPAVLVVALLYFRDLDALNTHKDRFLFSLIMLLATYIHFLVNGAIFVE